MKKLKTHFLIPSLLVSLFFCFITPVKADTYNYTFNNNPFQYINTNEYNTWRQSVLDYRDTKEDGSSYYYIIYYASNKLQAVLLSCDTLILSYVIEGNYPYFSLTSSERKPAYLISNRDGVASGNGSNASYNFNRHLIDMYSISSTADGFLILETDIPNITSTLNDTFYFTYNDYSFIYPNNDNLYTAVDWYNYYNGDPYPVISSYFTLIVDKITTLANYFYTNTYLLAIPLIPIILLCIYLIRRSLIK